MTYELQEQYNSKNFTPKALVKSAFGYPRTIIGITLHHWGNKGQKFDTVRDYLCNNNTPTSAHYVAMAGKVACIVSPEDAAWHSGNAKGNAQTIGIECRPEATDGDYQTVAELIASIRAVYGDMPLYRHSDWTSTACPGQWDLKRLDALARATTPPLTTTEDDMFTDADRGALRDLFQALPEIKEAAALIRQRVNRTNYPDGRPMLISAQGDNDIVLNAVAGVKVDGTVDVDVLAEKLKGNLAADVAKELGRKLAS